MKNFGSGVDIANNCGIIIVQCGSDSVVECHLAKVKVAGSNPVFRSILPSFLPVLKRGHL